MKNKRDRVTYITKIDLVNDVGVASKIREMQESLSRYGYYSQIQNINDNSVYSVIKRVHRIIRDSGSNIIILRSLGILNFWILPTLIYYKQKGVVFIMDMPTPRSSALHEIIPYRRGFRKLSYIFLHYLHGPWALWVYTTVIQYGNESRYFLFGNRKRTIFMGNSISTKRLSIREQNYKWPSNELKLMAVAKFKAQHGYDRILKAIQVWNLGSKQCKLTLTLIGDGSFLEELRRIIDELNLNEYISMPGRMDLEAIQKEYSTHHLAVSALGLYRLGLHSAGALKAREYCLAGIPFLASGDDPDFDDSCPFRYVVKNEDEIDSIIEQIEVFLETRDLYTDEDIRKYAVEHLSLESKLARIGIPDLRASIE